MNARVHNLRAARYLRYFYMLASAKLLHRKKDVRERIVHVRRGQIISFEWNAFSTALFSKSHLATIHEKIIFDLLHYEPCVIAITSLRPLG